MPLITELPRISDVLMFEESEEVNYVRDQITLISGGAACVVGQALGQITKAVPTAVLKGGSTGNGTCTALSNGPVVKIGAYTLTFTSATAFTVTDPNGDSLPAGVNGAYTDAQINFTVTAGGTPFIAGDGFAITAAAGSGKWAQVAPAAVDGTQNAAGICVLAANPTSADALSVAVTRGPAILKASGIIYTGGMTGGQKTAAVAQLAALGITTRSDYGV
jgi:hypothetical protein